MRFKQSECSYASNGFTRVELLTILVCITFGCALTLPIRAGYKTNTDRAVCSNNLRTIGVALHRWINDNPAHKTPWWVPFQNGGTLYVPKAANAYLEFYTLTNEVRGPQVFACPADTGVSFSSDWQDFRFRLQGKGCSYNIAAECDGARNNTWVCGDRNMAFDGGPTTCSLGINNAFEISFLPQNTTKLEWTPAVHGQNGNLLMWNGGVEFTSSERLRTLTADPANGDVGSESSHVLRARNP